jgi:nitrite reductase/ring-hydroxylating ferredoxin subunit
MVFYWTFAADEEKAVSEETPEPEAVNRVYIIFLFANGNHECFLKTCTHADAVEFAKQKSAENVDCGVHVAPISDTYITRTKTETVRM